MCVSETMARKRDMYNEQCLFGWSGLSYETIQKSVLKREAFWQYLQMRENIFKGYFIMDKNQVRDLLDLHEVAHKAAVLYKLLNK